MTEMQDGRALRQQNIYDENKIKLINTAINVINEIGDINEVTLSQIAKEAGVSPATAYNHFPDRMSDLYSSIAKYKLDVRETFMESMGDESKSLMDTIKEVPYLYGKKMVELGYTGQVLVTQMGQLQAKDKWLEDDPVSVLANLLTQEGTFVGVNNNTDFLSSVKEGEIVCEATWIKGGKSYQLWESKIFHNDKLCAVSKVRLSRVG